MNKAHTIGRILTPERRTLFAVLCATGLILPQTVRADSEVEPNNSLGEASAVGNNATVNAAIGIAGDQDWYKVVVPGAGRLRLSLANPPANMRGQIELYSRHADWMGVYATAINDGDDLHLSYDITEPGTYFFRVIDADSDFAPAGYVLQTRFTPVTEVSEPNNRTGQARLLTASPASAFIFDGSDRDFFKVYAPTGNTLAFSIQSPPAMRSQIELYDPDFAWMGVYATAVNPGDLVNLSHLVQRSGMYYARVVDAAGLSHTNAYSLTVSGGTLGYVPPQSPVASETEPNNRLGDAHLVNVGAAVSGRIAAAFDRDWYRFVPTQTGQLSVACTRSPAALAMRFQLYDDSGNGLVGGQAGGAGQLFSLTYDIRTSAPLYLAVDCLADLTSADTYEFQTQLTPVTDAYEPNDNYGDARLITQLNRLEGYVFPTGDWDWFQVNVSGPTNLTITMSEVADNITPQIWVYDLSKRGLASGAGSAGMDYALTYSVPAAGRYLIAVGDAGNNDEAVSPYTLTILGATFLASAPVASIDTIAPGAIVQGEAIQFSGSGVDADGTITGYAWRSSLDGALSTQASFSTTTLSLGTHTIYFRVRDNAGLWSTEVSALVYVGSSVSTEVESNDTLSRANEIALNHVVRGKINAVGDRDYFRVYVDQPGHLEFRVSNVPTNLLLQAACYNHTWDWLGIYRTAPLDGSDVTVALDVTTKGFIYLSIEDVRGQANTNLTYMLVATNAVALDAFEENDAMAQAYRLTNASLNALFFPAGDPDWYAVWVEAGAGVTATVTPPSTARPQVEFYDVNRNWIGVYATAVNDGDTITISNQFSKSGFVFVRVTETQGRANWTQPYTLTVAGGQPGYVPVELPVSAEVEPNGEISAANRVALGVAVSGGVSTNWDGDWYSVVLPTPGLLRASLDVPDPLRGRVSLYRSDASQINSRTGTNPGDDVVLDTFLVEPGTYYFLVDSPVQQPAPRAYQFTVSTTPVVDAFENNNRQQYAVRLAQQNRIQAYVFPAGDADWYQVSADAGAVLRVTVADVPSTIRPWVGIYDRHGTLLASKQASNDGQELSLEQSVPETADYFLRILDAPNSRLSVDPYTLVITGARFNSYVPLAFIDSVTPNPAVTNDPVTLIGHGTDQDGSVIAYEWRSSLDGVFSQSAVVSDKRNFSVGRHVISLKVKDNAQNWSPETSTILYVGSTLPQEIEPNAVAGAGTRLELDLLYSGTIHPAGDADWYRIYVPQVGRLVFDIINPSAPDNQMRTQFEFYGRDIEWLGRYVTAANPLDPVQFVLDITVPGEYYLRVIDAGGQPNGRYTLQAHLGPVQDAFEPNDSAATAALVAATSRNEAFVYPAGDRDWYKLTVDHPGRLVMALTNMPSDLRGQIEFYDRDQNWLGVYSTANNDGEVVNLVYDIPAPGTWYLRVIDADDQANATVPYTLALDFTPVVDVFEANGDFSSASPLTASPVQAFFFRWDDQDFYKVYAVPGATLGFTVDQVPAGVRPEFNLYNGSLSYLTYAQAPANGQPVTLQWPGASGYYYLRVRDINNVGSPFASYRLSVSNANLTYVPPSTPGAAEAEPNGEWASASLIAVGDSLVTGSCGAAGDYDWYRFTVDRPGLLTAALDAPAGLLGVVGFYDANGTLLAERYAENRGDDIPLSVPIRTAGTYYLLIRDQTAATSGNYQFTLTLNPAQDTNEPNNRFSETTPLNFGQPADGAIFPNGDSDWFLLRVDEPGWVRFEVQPVPSAIQIGLSVFNADGGQVFNAERMNSGDPLDASWQAVTPGWYRVQLYDRGWNDYATSAYHLLASFTPMRDPAEPNNSFGVAADWAGTNQLAAVIYPAGDNDYFRFTVSQAGWVRLQVSQAEGIQPVIRIFNDSNNQLGSATALNLGDTMELQYNVTTPGTYYAAISDRDNNQVSEAPYLLTILGGSFSVYHPLASISGLSPNPTVVGQGVGLSGSGVDQDQTVSGYEWWSDRDGLLGNGAMLVTSSLSEGVHRIGLRVQDSAGNWSARVYRDLVVATAIQTEDEPNNSAAQAFPLAVDSWITGRINPAGDSDYYRIHVGTTGYLLMQLNALPRTMRPQVELYGPAGEWLGLYATAYNDGDYLHYGVYVNPGWYTVRVLDAGGRVQATTYALRCGFTPGGEATEPNDSAAQATLVSLNTMLTNAIISPPGDRDWYRFEVTQPGRLSILATNLPANLRPQIEIFDVNMAWLGVYGTAINTGEPLTVRYDIKRLGTYFARVVDAGSQASAQRFALHFAFTPVMDLHEDNDEIGRATLLTNGVVNAFSFPAGDYDYYKVYCQSGAVLRLWVTNPPPTSLPLIELFSPDQSWLGVYQQANNPGDAVVVQTTIPAAGIYFARVRDVSGLSQLTPYQLLISGGQFGYLPPFSPVVAESENNGSISQANDIALATWVSGTILPVGDYDWFRFYINAPGLVRITHSGVQAPLLSELWVYNASSGQVGYRRTTNPGETNVLDLQMIESGYYYVRLHDQGDSHATNAPYALRVEHTPVVDPFEPNNEFATATRLGQPTVNAFLFAGNDEDWFRIYLRGPGTLALSLDVVPPQLRPHLWIYDANLNNLGNWVETNPGVGGTNVLSRAVTAGGYYYVRVRDEAGGVSASPYTLRITGADFTPAPELAAIGDRTLTETLSYVIVLQASNPDNSQTLTYSAANLPPGATFDPPTRTFRWTPARSTAGTYPGVQFQVSNGTQSDSESITLTVLPYNHQPVLAWTGESGYVADGVSPEVGTPVDNFVYRVVYSDADGDLPQAGWPKVHILTNGVSLPGSPFALTAASASPITAGRVFTLSKNLPAGTNYTYRFQAFDTLGTPAVGVTNLMTGPQVLLDSDGDGLPDWWEQMYFGSPTAATRTGDPDNDRFLNWSEYRAGTIPTNALSFLGIRSMKITSGGTVVSWSSELGKVYHLERTTDLTPGFNWVVGTNLPATPPLNTFTDTNAVGKGPFFYRIRLE